MKKYTEAKNLPFKELKGISPKTIENHYEKLYKGYVKKCQEIQDKLKTADKSLANAIYSDLRELKAEETFAANAVILHEAYFDILGGPSSAKATAGKDGKQSGQILKAIENDFGSYENWLAEFKALGLCARGWVFLAYDFNDGKLHNYTADLHNQGGVWGSTPIIVLDVYEHAYFADFGTDRKGYIEAYFSNLNWEAIDRRYVKITK